MRITEGSDIDRLKPEEQPRYITRFLTQVAEAMNNNLSFVDNFNASTVAVPFSTANTDTAVLHGLGRVPVGYIVIGQNAAMSVYDGASANTTSLLYLRSSAVGTARLLVY